MLAEVGVRFGFKGGREAINMMNRLQHQYGALANSVDRGSSRINSGFSRMASGMKAGAAVGIAAMTALTAAAIAIPYKLAQSRAELTNEQANLRALGLDDAAIHTFEESAEAFASKVAGVTKAAYTRASYDVVSAFAGITAEEQTKIADMALITGKATKMSAESATKLFGSLWGAAGDEMKAKGAEPFVKQWSGAVYTAVKELKTTGEELASAAKNSISMLMEAGWKPEEMTAFWGQLITSGLSGEAAGTALKQMALKERGAFGKLIAKASGQMKDTEFLKGRAKEEAEAFNKGMVEGAGRVGSELFKSDPMKWLNRMGEAFDKLKAQGGDYKKFIAEIFGEESANAMIQFFDKRGSMKRTIDTIARGSYDDVRRIVEEQMSKGIGPATAIMGQLWQNLKETMGQTTGGLVTPVFSWLGEKMIQANALWKALFTDINPIEAIRQLERAGGDALVLLADQLYGLPGNIAAFAEAFKTGFLDAFGGLGAVNSELARLVELVGSPDSEKWKKIGDEIGRIAGTDLKGFLSALDTIKTTIQGIWTVLGPVLKMLNWAAGTSVEGYGAAYKLFRNEMVPGMLQDERAKRVFKSWEADDRALFNRAGESASGLFGQPQAEGPAYPGFHGPRAPDRPRMRPGPGGGSAGPVTGAAPPAQVQVEGAKVEVNVKIGERELNDYITEVFQREASRQRQGAGDGFKMGMF